MSVQTADADIVREHAEFRPDARETFASAGQPRQGFACLEKQVRFAAASTDKQYVNIQTADPGIVGEPLRFRFGVDRNLTNCAPKFPFGQVRKFAEKEVVACSW